MTTHMRSRTWERFSLLAVFAVVVALVASIASTASAAAQGSVDEGTGTTGRVATNGSWNGTYWTPIAGGEEEGWCVDPGLPEPKSGGNTDAYGDPVVWDAPNDQQRTQLLAALTIGDAARNAKNAGIDKVNIPGFAQLLGSSDVDAIGAAVSGVIHKIGYEADPRPGANWDPNVLDRESRAVYENLLRFAGFIPGINLDIPLMIREPAGNAANHQRMILMGDIKLPEINVPEFEDAVEEAPVEEEKVVVPGKITVNKVDQDGEVLPGAKFELRELDEEEAEAFSKDEELDASKVGEVIYTWETEDEEMTFLLDAGTYAVVELEAPEGYTGEFSDIVTVKDEDDTVLDVTNTKEEEETTEETTPEETSTPEETTEEETSEETTTSEEPTEEETTTSEEPTEEETTEHKKAPVKDQERATIVSVPSGPVGPQFR